MRTNPGFVCQPSAFSHNQDPRAIKFWQADPRLVEPTLQQTG